MKSHELTVRIQVRALCGELTDPQSCKSAIYSLEIACKQTARLIGIHNPRAGIHAPRIEWSNPRNNPWSVVAHTKTHIALDADRTLDELKAMSAARIAQMSQSAERETLRRLNNAFADNGLEGTISLGGVSVVLSNMAFAYPIQRGTPWQGIAIATPINTAWLSSTLRLNREGQHQPFSEIVVHLPPSSAFLTEAVGKSLVYVAGSGTVIRSTLHVSRVESIRVATQEDLASANIDTSLF